MYPFVQFIWPWYFFQAAYDHLRKARKAAEERNERLDSERKKVKLGDINSINILLKQLFRACLYNDYICM